MRSRLLNSLILTLILALALPVVARGQRGNVESPRNVIIPVTGVLTLEQFCPESGPNLVFGGYAAQFGVTGGCVAGRKLIRVTSLTLVDDSPATTATQLGCDSSGRVCSNPGADGHISIIEALRVSGDRAVGSDVAGWFTHATGSEVFLGAGGLTFYGGDAPGQGIGFRRLQFNVRRDVAGDPFPADNVIISQVRFRYGSDASVSGNGIIVRSDGLVLDHVSIYWAVGQQNLNLRGAISGSNARTTVQNSIIGEPGLNSSGNILQYNSVAQSTLFKNLILTHTRNPEVGLGKFDLVNNVIYNPFAVTIASTTLWLPGGALPGDGTGGVLDMNVEGNDYVAGPDTNTTGNQNETADIRTEADREFSATSSIAVIANRGHNCTNASQGCQANLVWQNNGPVTLNSSRVGSMPSPGTIVSAAQARTDVLSNAGVIWPCRDAVDANRIAQAQAGTGPEHGDRVESYPDLTQPCSNPPLSVQPRTFVTTPRPFITAPRALVN